MTGNRLYPVNNGKKSMSHAQQAHLKESLYINLALFDMTLKQHRESGSSYCRHAYLWVMQ